MNKRTKKPPVKPEKRLEWLQRVERDGETLSHIAESDSFDIRTVRKHVELARMERDVHQARTEVLRNALEGHYGDLMETVRNIENWVSSEVQVSLEKGVSLMSGLREHMPRSPLWESLRKWNRTLTELAELSDVIRNKIQREIEADGRLNGIVSQGANGVIPAAIDVLVHQVKQWTRGLEGLKMDRDIHLEKTSEGRVKMRYGFSHFGELEERSVEIIKAVLIYFESELKHSPEYLEMEKLIGRLERLKKGIGEVLTVVLLRRIVPGRCRYCPL
ncbi:MAG: hypothetical protein GH158_07115 [Dehalococcoidia bacterium]|nr:hypothetical protein [Dehalococcoidia bacterium]